MRCIAAAFMFLVCIVFCAGFQWAAGEATVLHEPVDLKATPPLLSYLAKPDTSYHWHKVREGQLGGVDYAELILTSQQWRGTLWKHRLFVFKPKEVDDSKQAILVIAGGKWKKEYEDPGYQEKSLKKAAIVVSLAEQLGSPVAVLLQVPQQPIFDGMVEDEIISHTFEKFLETGDSEWPLLLPMVKSAVRAMDAVQEFCESECSLPIENFTVTGGSKRGWTTWLTAASDPRVTAIAPMVIDMLNLSLQMKHQLETWGRFSEEIHDYTERNLPERMITEAGEELVQIVDPLAYRDSLTLPKLIILGTNDRYWPLDALNLYWDQLQGPKYVLYVPNNGHALQDFPRVLGSIAALHEQAKGGKLLPKPTWSLAETDNGITITIESNVPPAKCVIWKAASQNRDFRDSLWVETEPTPVGDGFRFHLDTPEAGSAAFFGEVVYDRKYLPLHLSTNVCVLSAATKDEKKDSLVELKLDN